MTQEQEFDAYERAEALRREAALLESPDYAEGVQKGANTTSAALLAAMVGGLPESRRRQLLDMIEDNPGWGWPEAVQARDNLLRTSQGATASRTGTQAAPQQAGEPKTMSEADARFNLPMNHPNKLSIEEYRKARKRFGIRPDGSHGPTG
jgi:hypothetical protein